MTEFPASSPPSRVVLVKHAAPILDASRPPREWRLSPDGERQSGRLATALARFTPLRLVSSREPKAGRTAEIAAAALGVSWTTGAGLEEIDRPALPIMPASEHERVNARLFAEFGRPVVGCESARDARDRFTAAVVDELQRTTEDTLVVVAHGTVIALLASAHNPIDALGLWRQLQCPSFVVLEAPSLRLLEVVAAVS